MIVSPALLERFAAQARAELPNEAVAIFSGPAEGRATTYRPARNASPGPSSFRVSLLERMRLLRAIAGAGETAVAIVHSHPNGSLALSPTDLDHARRWGTLSWIVYAPAEHAFAAFDSTGKRIALTTAG